MTEAFTSKLFEFFKEDDEKKKKFSDLSPIFLDSESINTLILYINIENIKNHESYLMKCKEEVKKMTSQYKILILPVLDRSTAIEVIPSFPK